MPIALTIGLLAALTAAGLFVIGMTNVAWMLYAWFTPEHLERTGFGRELEATSGDHRSFSLIVPARHEELVLEATLSRLACLRYPTFDVLAVVGHDDPRTRAVADQVAQRWPERVRVVVDDHWPKNKPKALNTALPQCRGDVVGVFDAEDEVHPDLLRRVDERFSATGVSVVQGGVQLMNYWSNWWSVHNVLEYYFWFRSRLHYQADRRFIPLGGNTVFIQRDRLLATGGWDPECLAEDCELGVRLSAQGERTVVAYDPELVTREETPESLGALVRQRTRWNQGFLQVVRKGHWSDLPTIRQRAFASYALAAPFLQAFAGVLIPPSIIAVLWLKLPIVIALLSFMPVIPMLLALAIQLVGLREFASHYGTPLRLLDYVRLVFGFPCYQVFLAYAALRAVARELCGQRGWEKTSHVGAHRAAAEENEALGTTTARIEELSTRRLPSARRRGGAVAAGWGSNSSTEIDVGPRPAPQRGARLRRWLGAHWREVAVLAIVLVAVGFLTAWNVDGAPQRVDDEGTYMAEAWSLVHWGTLAPYTYWYDHPPLGWLLIAAWTWATAPLHWPESAIYAGRAFMVVVQVVSAALLFALGRRLRLPIWAAIAATILFSVCPLALLLHRQVYLDNLATPFLLGSFILASSPRRRLASYAGCGVSFAAAVLTKETSLVFLPAVCWQMLACTDRRTRSYAIAVAVTCMLSGCSIYVLYAILKGELVPGKHHVSLLGSVAYQLVSRQGSGSIFRAGTFGNLTVTTWLTFGGWLLATGLALLPAALLSRRLRPVAGAYAVGVLLVVKPGYLPTPLVIGLLPFAALTAAGGAWALATSPVWFLADSRPRTARWLQRLTVAFAAGVTLAFAGPAWFRADKVLLTHDAELPYQRALVWIKEHVPHDDRLLVDDSVWVDLVNAGFSPDHVVWFYKIDTDPAIERRFPNGWRDFQYVLSSPSLRSNPYDQPDVYQALIHSAPAATFGRGPELVAVRRIESGAA